MEAQYNLEEEENIVEIMFTCKFFTNIYQKTIYMSHWNWRAHVSVRVCGLKNDTRCIEIALNANVNAIVSVIKKRVRKLCMYARICFVWEIKQKIYDAKIWLKH